MFNFFYTLYFALFRGYWSPQAQLVSNNAVTALGNKVASFLICALGGNYSAVQTFDWNINIGGTDYTLINHVCTLLSLVTFIGVCFAVWKIIKSVFFIFFEGWR